MICLGCGKKSSNIIITSDGTERCHNCLGVRETSGTATDKILTRNSDRMVEQQQKMEGDMITPWIMDKNTKELVVNEDFVKLYPEQARDTFTQEELDKSGHTLITVKDEEEYNERPEFTGDEDKGIKETLDAAQED